MLTPVVLGMQAQAVGRDAAEGATGSVEGQGKGQQPQQRRPQQAVGQVQHNQAAVKQKLLERLADDVRMQALDTILYKCVLGLIKSCQRAALVNVCRQA